MKRFSVVFCLLGALPLCLWAASAAVTSFPGGSVLGPGPQGVQTAIKKAVTDFSGTWILDPGKSQGQWNESTWTITQNDKEIEIAFANASSTGPDSSSWANGTETWQLDGSESTKETQKTYMSGMTGESWTTQVTVTRKTRWSDSGKVLELIEINKYNDGQENYTQRLELAGDGKTLKVQGRIESTSSNPVRPGGSYVYTKK
jgi:hypothetical protein